jgi:KUP system potassium uptake protein
VEPRDSRVFRCVVRYGYNDKVEDPREFEGLLIGHLKQFVYQESFYSQGDNSVDEVGNEMEPSTGIQETRLSKSSSDGITSALPNGWISEIQLLQREMDNGVVHMLGETNVVAEANADLFKKIIVDYAYNFMRKNFRQPEKITCVPHNRLLWVGMTYGI